MSQQYDLAGPFANRGLHPAPETVVDAPAEGYYEHAFRCGNCRTKVTRYIRKGERIDNVSFECPNCGCTISEKGIWQEL